MNKWSEIPKCNGGDLIDVSECHSVNIVVSRRETVKIHPVSGVCMK